MCSWKYLRVRPPGRVGRWLMDLFGIYGITLWPFGIFFTSNDPTWFDIHHERIHESQQKEMLVVFFYLWYFFEWLIRVFRALVFRKGNAYKDISFEREAYENETDILYERNRYAWFKYLLNKK